MSDEDEQDRELEAALATHPGDAPPSRALRDRVLASTHVTSRFDDLAGAVAALLDVTLDAARALLLRVDAPASWSEGPAAGVALFHVDGGPAIAGAVAGFVRLEAGGRFPAHEHLGEEHVLVVQGALRDSHGHQAQRGEVATMAPGTAHELEAIGPLPLVYLVVAQRGVRIGGEVIGPGDPRG